VVRVAQGLPGQPWAAVVQLDGESEPRTVTYWPELLEQWGADRLRAHLVYEASQQRAADEAEAAQASTLERHAAELPGGADAQEGPTPEPTPPETPQPVAGNRDSVAPDGS
jgi:hypothetical protein